MYYLRTKAAVDAIKFTLNNDKKAETIDESEAVALEVAAPNETGEMTAPPEVIGTPQTWWRRWLGCWSVRRRCG
jgi:hypothetical protein